MLVHSKDTISAISQECGLGSSSFFGKTFREHMGMAPMEYRKNGGIVIYKGIKKIFYSLKLQYDDNQEQNISFMKG